MEVGIVVNLLLGILWALGCLIFVVFLFEFREDMFVHSIYPGQARRKMQEKSNPNSFKTQH